MKALAFFGISLGLLVAWLAFVGAHPEAGLMIAAVAGGGFIGNRCAWLAEKITGWPR